MGETKGPETDVMALAGAIVDGFLESYVLPSPKKIESAERCGGIGRVHQKCSYHSQRACDPQTVGRRPARRCKGIPELLKSADEDEIDRIAGQTISRDRVSRDKPPMKNLQGQSDHVRQDDVSSQAICKAGRKNPWKSVIRSIEYDEDYQPNAKYTQTKNQEPLEKAHQQPHNTFSRLKQFQEKCEAVFRPELRKNKGIEQECDSVKR
jgi:hypothetical protein